ncbi:hypothetical protein FA95DRAFT_179543 [Auriscalpium vulgare]|uniref:Uncharacterized protein n=1 Tax=Auriscalpium vulgare TaxID=40419 RepID=A0ACB8RLI9_9AGAM|nr:hypothetical protein FA95DRAFT_179543 [Auriscalpium vulgare]
MTTAPAQPAAQISALAAFLSPGRGDSRGNVPPDCSRPYSPDEGALRRVLGHKFGTPLSEQHICELTACISQRCPRTAHVHRSVPSDITSSKPSLRAQSIVFGTGLSDCHFQPTLVGWLLSQTLPLQRPCVLGNKCLSSGGTVPTCFLWRRWLRPS